MFPKTFPPPSGEVIGTEGAFLTSIVMVSEEPIFPALSLALISNVCSPSINTTTLIDGEHTLLIRAKDNAGKIGSSETITIAVRNAPSVTITSPEGGAKVSGKIALIYVNTPKKDAFIVSDTLFIDGKAYASLDTSGVDSLTTT